jgi:hypothetical protein
MNERLRYLKQAHSMILKNQMFMIGGLLEQIKADLRG